MSWLASTHFPPHQTHLRSFCYIKSLHSSYIQNEYNDKEEIINKTFITCVETLLDRINHPVLLQECKLNIDATAYEKKGL